MPARHADASPRKHTPRAPTKPKPHTTTLAAPTIAVVLDETGSMDSVKAATIGSYNGYVQTLQRSKDNEGARFALTRFNSCGVRTETADLAQAPLLTDANYRPACNTPLYEAICRTVSRLDEDKPEGPVIVVVLTDGQENSSAPEFTRERVRSLIQEREATGRWTFIYLGSNQDAWAVGQSFGLHGGNTMSYVSTGIGTVRAMHAAASATDSITRGYYASGGTTASSAKAFSDAGVDRCLACGSKITFDTPHVCAGGPR